MFNFFIHVVDGSCYKAYAMELFAFERMIRIQLGDGQYLQFKCEDVVDVQLVRKQTAQE